ncbi:MAG: NTPase [Aquificae bacterium]|nr:NTPase [Aquificota bacterium]
MIIAVTGKVRSGKTTAVKKVLQAIQDRAIGFYTEEIKDPKTNQRIGFKVVTTDGRESILALKGKKGRYKIGSYSVNVEEFEKTVIPLLEEALNQKDKIIVIDEIGKMELLSRKFTELVDKIISQRDIKAIVTVPLKDVHPIVKKIKTSPDTILIHLTPSNRDQIPKKILEILDER